MARYEKLNTFTVRLAEQPADNGPGSIWHAELRSDDEGSFLVTAIGKTPSKAVRAAFREIGL